jgi:sugar phosphate permease
VGGGIAAILFEKTGTWNYAFFGSAALALLAALMALYVRRMPLPVKRPEALTAPPVSESAADA